MPRARQKQDRKNSAIKDRQSLKYCPMVSLNEIMACSILAIVCRQTEASAIAIKDDATEATASTNSTVRASYLAKDAGRSRFALFEGPQYSYSHCRDSPLLTHKG